MLTFVPLDIKEDAVTCPSLTAQLLLNSLSDREKTSLGMAILLASLRRYDYEHVLTWFDYATGGISYFQKRLRELAQFYIDSLPQLPESWRSEEFQKDLREVYETFTRDGKFQLELLAF